MVWIFKLFLSVGYALTLESHCQRIHVTPERVERTLIDNGKCWQDKYLASVPALEKEKSLVLEREEEEAFFCKAPMDQLSLLDNKDQKKLHTWKAVNDYKRFVTLTTAIGVMRFNLEDSKKRNDNICNALPAFFRMKAVPEDSMSESVKEMSKGGYMLISARVPSLFFIDKELKRLQFSFNLAEEVRLSDALIRKNGDLILLTSEKLKTKIKTCLEKWDLVAGTMMSAYCDLKGYDQQILIDQGEIVRAYKIDDSIFFEEFNSKGESKIINEAKGAANFDLKAAYVF